MDRRLIVGFLTLFALSIGFGSPANAQRIGIEDAASEGQSGDTETKTETSQETSAASNRIIPPEEFGKYRNQATEESDLSKDALIEKIRADSASMRIRFREKIRELKADSRAMRKTIRQLRRQKRRLSRKVNQGGGSGVTETVRGQSEEVDTPSTPDLRSVGGDEDTEPGQSMTEDAGGTRAEESSADDTGERTTSGSGVKLNPNTASLSDLKAIPDLSNRLAERIEWYRREVRPFQDRQDLRRVPGIDRGTFDSIKEHFREGPY